METLQVISGKGSVRLTQTQLEKGYPNLKKSQSHFFYDINYNTETFSIYVFVCLKMLLTTVILKNKTKTVFL